jgi:hypothetical protein
MTTNEMQLLLGKTVRYRINGLLVDVNILDVKIAWNIVKVLISPVAGTGSVWVNLDSTN